MIINLIKSSFIDLGQSFPLPVSKDDIIFLSEGSNLKSNTSKFSVILSSFSVLGITIIFDSNI